MNPQAAAAAAVKEYTGHEDLGAALDADTWLTPRWILDHLGPFDLDPCSALAARGWVCPNELTIEDDGIKAEWRGRVFMNPPFSNTIPWLLKHARHGKGISLVPASVESKVWRDVVWTQAKAIFLLHGRTRFCRPDGSTTTGRPLRSVVLIGWDDEEREVLAAVPFAGILLTQWRHQ